jgi:hypothetical protein
VLRNLEDVSTYESKVCPFDQQTAKSCFREKEIENIEAEGSENWESILGLDWYVFQFLKGAEDWQLELFGLEPAAKNAWYDWVDGPTFLLMQTLDTFEELWTLECTKCIPIETVSLLGDLDTDQLLALANMSETDFEEARLLGQKELTDLGYSQYERRVFTAALNHQSANIKNHHPNHASHPKRLRILRKMAHMNGTSS